MINKRIAEVVALAEILFGVNLTNLETRVDLKGTGMGHAEMFEDRSMVIRLSIEGCRDHWDTIVSDTIPHEIAHLVCFLKGIDNGHGTHWKAVARALGSLGETTHNKKLKSTLRMFHYCNPDGGRVDFTIIRHNRLQNGKVLSYKGKEGTFTKADFLAEV